MTTRDAEHRRWLAETEAIFRQAGLPPDEVARMVASLDADVSRIVAETAAAAVQAAAQLDDEDERERGPEQRVVWREDYVPKDDEDRYLVRDDEGRPLVRLVDAGDRLVVWSPVDGGGLLNPKGPGLRRYGCTVTYVRGGKYTAGAYRTADLRKWSRLEVIRHPSNPHDKNAVELYPAGGPVAVGYVQRGRAPAVARRLDAGERLAGVCLWGPGPGEGDRSTLVLIASERDLAAMLKV